MEAEVGAYLLLALYEGIAVLQALDKESMDVERLSGAWAGAAVNGGLGAPCESKRATVCPSHQRPVGLGVTSLRI